MQSKWAYFQLLWKFLFCQTSPLPLYYKSLLLGTDHYFLWGRAEVGEGKLGNFHGHEHTCRTWIVKVLLEFFWLCLPLNNVFWTAVFAVQGFVYRHCLAPIPSPPKHNGPSLTDSHANSLASEGYVTWQNNTPLLCSFGVCINVVGVHRAWKRWK